MIVYISILTAAILLLKASSYSDNPLDKGIVFKRRDRCGDLVYLRITKKGKLIWCHAYREVKPGKFKSIKDRQWETQFDTRIDSTERLAILLPSSKDKIFKRMVDDVIEQVNDKILRKERVERTFAQ